MYLPACSACGASVLSSSTRVARRVLDPPRRRSLPVPVSSPQVRVTRAVRAMPQRRVAPPPFFAVSPRTCVPGGPGPKSIREVPGVAAPSTRHRRRRRPPFPRRRGGLYNCGPDWASLFLRGRQTLKWSGGTLARVARLASRPSRPSRHSPQEPRGPLHQRAREDLVIRRRHAQSRRGGGACALTTARDVRRISRLLACQPIKM